MSKAKPTLESELKELRDRLHKLEALISQHKEFIFWHEIRRGNRAAHKLDEMAMAGIVPR